MELHAHDLTIDDAGGRISIKETVYVNFDTAWRGRPVIVTMQASRYTYGDGALSDWQIYAHKAVEADQGEAWMGYRKETTDLARQRLGAQLRDEMANWLCSDAYTKSEARAYFYEIRNHIRNARPYSDNPTLREKHLIALYKDKLGGFENERRLYKMCGAYDEFAKALDRGPWEPAKAEV